MGKTPFYYFPLGTISGRMVSTALTVFYGTVASIRMTKEIVRNRTSFFALKDRTGPNKPAPLSENYNKYGSWKHRFIQLNKQNIKLHYVEAGPSDRQLMLFVHGLPECWFSWRHQIKVFSPAYHTVAVNMRGYGDSDKPKGIIRKRQE